MSKTVNWIKDKINLHILINKNINGIKENE
jgi:hypothetical protein